MQGYLYQVDVDWFAEFARRFADRLPRLVREQAPVPAEVSGGAENLLRSLIGEPPETLTGNTNMVVALRGGNAIVTTSRSTDGQRVPISEVCNATGRSAFIGAVLRTVPGTVVGLEPPTVSFDVHAGSTRSRKHGSTPATAPQGALDAPTTRNVRTEQPALRRTLVGNKTLASPRR